MVVLLFYQFDMVVLIFINSTTSFQSLNSVVPNRYAQPHTTPTKLDQDPDKAGQLKRNETFDNLPGRRLML